MGSVTQIDSRADIKLRILSQNMVGEQENGPRSRFSTRVSFKNEPNAKNSAKISTNAVCFRISLDFAAYAPFDV